MLLASLSALKNLPGVPAQLIREVELALAAAKHQVMDLEGVVVGKLQLFVSVDAEDGTDSTPNFIHCDERAAWTFNFHGISKLS